MNLARTRLSQVSGIVARFLVEWGDLLKKHFSLFLAVFAFVVCCSFPISSEAAQPVVKADRQYYDFEKGQYVLKGNVVIEYNGYHVTAVEAKTDLVEVWANGGITFQKDDIQMNGSSIYFNFPKNILKVQGAVDFNRNRLKITADMVEFNWETKLAKFTGNVKVQNGDVISTYDTKIYNVGTNEI